MIGGYRTSLLGVVANGKRGGDPFWDFVVLLLSFDGTPGTRAYVDTSPYARAVSETGSNSISSAQSKFGGTSCLINDGAIEIADAAEMELGSGNWTIEWWQRVPSSNGGFAKDDIGTADSSVYPIAFDLLPSGPDRKLRLRLSTDGSSYAFSETWPTSGSGYVIDQWHHFALCRNGNTVAAYVDGVQQGSASFSGSVHNNGSRWSFGKCGTGGSTYANGYIDELRMTVGVCRYTGNFTPPSAAFPTTG